MNSEDKNTNQADELQKLFQETTENLSGNEENEQKREEVALREVDVLNLPPRKEVHTSQKRTKFKISRSFLRFLLISLLVIIILTVAFFLFEGEIVNLLYEL